MPPDIVTSTNIRFLIVALYLSIRISLELTPDIVQQGSLSRVIFSSLARYLIIYQTSLHAAPRIDGPALHGTVRARMCTCARVHAPRETYGTERRKYILTAFGRILMGGPLSVLCLTASSSFSSVTRCTRAIHRIRFTGRYFSGRTG